MAFFHGNKSPYQATQGLSVARGFFPDERKLMRNGCSKIKVNGKSGILPRKPAFIAS